MLIQWNVLLLLLLIITNISSSRLAEKFKSKLKEKIHEKSMCQQLTCISIEFSFIFSIVQIVDLELYTRQTPYVLRLATMHFQSQLSLKMMVKREKGGFRFHRCLGYIKMTNVMYYISRHLSEQLHTRERSSDTLMN